MTAGVPPATLAELVRVARATPGLELLMLFGSRARGDARPDSDWDFAYLASGGLDVLSVIASIASARDDRRASSPARRRAASRFRIRHGAGDRRVRRRHPAPVAGDA